MVIYLIKFFAFSFIQTTFSQTSKLLFIAHFELLIIFALKFGLTSGENRVCCSKSIILNKNKWKL